MPSQKLTEEQTGRFFEEWTGLREQLASLHQQRDKRTAEVMAEATALYERLLRQCAEFETIPINGEERLRFIKSNQGNYAAFRQLDELFTEMAKKIASKRAQLNRQSETG